LVHSAGALVISDTLFEVDDTISARWEKESQNNGSGNVSGNFGGGGSGGNGGAVNSYPVGAAAKPSNGTVSLDKKNVTKGSIVTITVIPAEGYTLDTLDTLAVTDAKNNKLELTNKGEGKYTFIMPGSKVNVDANFVKIIADLAEPTEPADQTNPVNPTNPLQAFGDLPDDAWYREAVQYALSERLMNGFGNGRFGPNENLSRAQLAQILYNRDGRPKDTGASLFSDISNDKWCIDAVI